MKHVVISIINFNKPDITKKCLQSLNNLDLNDITCEVLLIDNASDEPIAIDDKDYPNIKVTVHKSRKNTGFSGGHNIGFNYALKHNANYCIVLNNDTVVDSQLIQELLKVGERNNDAGIIAPKIYFAKGSEYHLDRYKKADLGHVIWYAGGLIDWNNAYWTHRGVDEVDHKQFDTVEKTQFATGCCFAIKGPVLEKSFGI